MPPVDVVTHTPSPAAPGEEWTADRRLAWRVTLAVLTAALCGLAWLLARLIWLPFLFGLFFYLVAGLLVGAMGFRIARRARPAPGPVMVRGAILVSLAATAAGLQFEYLHFCGTALGDPPRFASARNKVIMEGGSLRDLADRAADAFRESLRDAYPPGGLLGYIRWTVGARTLPLDVDGQRETIANPHAGLLWPARTAMGFLLMTAGLWASLESLRSKLPVTNVLQPGEEYEEEED